MKRINTQPHSNLPFIVIYIECKWQYINMYWKYIFCALFYCLCIQ